MMTMPKCHDCGKFCRPVAWKMLYSGAIPEPQKEIYLCAACAEKNGYFQPQPGIRPECSCGSLTPTLDCRAGGGDYEKTFALRALAEGAQG